MLIQGRLLIDPALPPIPGWVETDSDRIVRVEEGSPPGRADFGGEDCLISPPFVDAHLHLPQFNSIGVDGLPLLEWLDRAIFPAESRWRDADVCRREIEHAYTRMVRAGTLGYAGYLTSHMHSVAEVVRVAHEIPLRAIVGQVLMDRHAPSDLLGHASARLSRSARGRLDASLNPRFAIACSHELLHQTGQRLREGFPHSFKEREPGDMGRDLFLQTHISESADEVALVHELFPAAPHYAAVYDGAGLLSPHTLLAHGVHLTPPEWELVTNRDCVIVHCPTANTFLQAGLFDLDAAREHGVRLALGSDVAAGPDIAMPCVARAMIDVAKVRAMTVAPNAHIPSPADVWSLITRGNADALGWGDFGRIEPGASADLLVIRPPFEIDDQIVSRLIYTWDDSYIVGRVLTGRHVRMTL